MEYILAVAAIFVISYPLRQSLIRKIANLTRCTFSFIKSLSRKHITFDLITNEAVLLSYERLGKKYSLAVPYERSLVGKMAQTRVYLCKDIGEWKEITQQPGIPYRVNAKMLDGISIVITNLDGDQSIILPADIIPVSQHLQHVI